jgi:NADPH:quinone reductase-like Zn-dependent oxidoreductase
MLDPLLLTGRGITVGAISVGSRADFEAMNRAIALHHLRPVIDRTFPFAEAKAATAISRAAAISAKSSRTAEERDGAIPSATLAS